MSAPVEPADEFTDQAADDDKWTCDELERLYREALDAVEAVASDLSSATQALAANDGNGEHLPSDDGVGLVRDHVAEPADPLAIRVLVSAAPENNGRTTAAQVVEALLFVGGQPLTAKTICTTLRGEFGTDFVEQAIDEINRRYSYQKRPYEVRLGDGGYRMVLRPEFEPHRNRVYGFGPRQVRLSQEILEILSIVAYRQPISRLAIEEIVQRSAGSHLRQLLQRELLVLDRVGGTPESEVTYRTSLRFLQLFGLAKLDDLPQIEDLSFK